MATDEWAFDPSNLSARHSISNENKTIEHTGSNAWSNSKCVREMETGKWYWEFRYDSLTYTGSVSQNIGISLTGTGNSVRCGNNSNAIGYEEWSPGYFWNNGSTSFGARCSVGDILQIAYNADDGEIWFGKNGTWLGAGSPDPATRTSPVKTGFTGKQLPTWCAYAVGNIATIRTREVECSYTAPSGYAYLYDEKYHFSGYVYELSDPVVRQVYAYRRDTGELTGGTTSSGDGYFYIETTYSGEHFIICLDDVAGETYNLLGYDLVVPVKV